MNTKHSGMPITLNKSKHDETKYKPVSSTEIVNFKLCSNMNEEKPDDSHFEEVMDTLGTFGHWQRVIFFLLCVPDLLGAFGMMVPVFAGATPDWHCVRYINHNGSALNGSLFNQTSTEEKCASHTWKCDQFSFHDDFTSIVSSWNLVCEQRYFISLIGSIQMVGLAVGAVIFGYLADFFGRKKCYFSSVLLMIVAGIGSGFTQSWASYSITRFLVGFGFGSYMVVNCTYPLEFVGPRWRTLCGTIGGWAIGIMILAVFGYFIREWRILVIVTSATGILFLPCWFLIPESPRWLLQRQRIDETMDIVDKIAKKNNKETPSKDLLLKIAERSRTEEAAERMYTYLDLFKTREYTKRALVMVCFWFYGFISYYTLSYNMRTMSFGNRYLNMFLGGLVDLPAMLSVILFNTVIGRKGALWLYTAITLLTAFSVIGIYGYSETHAPPGVQIEDFIPRFAEVSLGLALVGRAAALAITYVVQIYTAELFATVVRNIGTGAGAFAGRVGGIIAPQMVYLGTFFSLAPYIMCAGIGTIIIGLVYLLPETRGKPLDELPPAIVKEKPNLHNETTKL